MPTFVPDFVDALADELDEERKRLARSLDRAEALRELHSYAYDLAARLKKPLTIDDVFQSGQTEQERARLRLLGDRITGDAPGGHPAYDEGVDEGNLSETGAGL